MYVDTLHVYFDWPDIEKTQLIDWLTDLLIVWLNRVVFSGEHLRICHPGFTCCTQQMEHKLNAQSGQEFDRIMAEKISILRNTFISRTAKFDGESSVVMVTVSNTLVFVAAWRYQIRRCCKLIFIIRIEQVFDTMTPQKAMDEEVLGFNTESPHTLFDRFTRPILSACTHGSTLTFKSTCPIGQQAWESYLPPFLTSCPIHGAAADSENMGVGSTCHVVMV